MSEMDAGKAREILANCRGELGRWIIPATVSGESARFETWHIEFVKGYLSCLEGPEVKALVEAANMAWNRIAPTHVHIQPRAGCSDCRLYEALTQFQNHPEDKERR